MLEYMTEIGLPWLVRLAVGGVGLITLGSLAPTTAWFARGCDFPRVHIVIASLVVGVGAVLVHEGVERTMVASLAGGFAAWHLIRIVPFTTLYRRHCRSAHSSNVSIVIANLDYENTRRGDVAAALAEQNADLMLIIEIDDAWCHALAAIRDRYPHRLECVRGEGLGIALWSRFELGAESVEFLMSDRRPSLWATVEVPGAGALQFAGLHPTPPGLTKPDDDERFDSDNRDAELTQVAQRVAETDGCWLIAGDLNDVAWSRTTSEFKQRSGLVDPRVGRGFINSFHAQYPLLRYPLDHVFVSRLIGVADFHRFRVPGSDHFGLRAEMLVPEAEPANDETSCE